MPRVPDELVARLKSKVPLQRLVAGPAEIAVPRDRAGTFEPVTVA